MIEKKTKKLALWILKHKYLLLLVFICLIGLGIRLHHLDHDFIKPWDELFHAIVARNVVKHPLTPTFYDQPWLPTTYEWDNSHIWLHKPPLTFWQIALSFRLFGVNPFSLRLPSVLLSIASIFLTFLMGKQLFSSLAGLIAASLHAMSPFDVTLVQGYLFGDHVDVSLLFWTELSFYLIILGIKRGHIHYYIFAGIAEGMAFLSKSYLALISISVLVLLWIIGYINKKVKGEGYPITGKQLALYTCSFILAILPWTLYSLIRFPEEFIYEQSLIFQHFGREIDDWGAPWDGHLFGYLQIIYRYFYLPILLCAIYVVYRSIRYREWNITLIGLWISVTIFALSIPRTKEPSITYIAFPAFLIAIGYVSEQTLQRRHSQLALAWLASLISSCIFIIFESGYIQLKYKPIEWLAPVLPTLSAKPMLLAHILSLIVIFYALIRISPDLTSKGYKISVLCFTLMFILLMSYFKQSIDVTNINLSINNPSQTDIPQDYPKLGMYVQQHFPLSACLLIEETYSDQKYNSDRIYLMFYSDRSVYFVTKGNLAQTAYEITAAGGIPYLITREVFDWAKVVSIGSYHVYQMAKNDLPSKADN